MYLLVSLLKVLKSLAFTVLVVIRIVSRSTRLDGGISKQELISHLQERLALVAGIGLELEWMPAAR